MAKVNLFFETFPEEGTSRQIIRLKCGVQFKGKEGWTLPESAIIDTGAHISVLPAFVWKELDYVILKEDYFIFGLSKLKECAIKGNLARVKLLIVDELGNQTEELAADFFLAESHVLPIIIGFDKVLEKFRIDFNFKNKTGYLEATP